MIQTAIVGIILFSHLEILLVWKKIGSEVFYFERQFCKFANILQTFCKQLTEFSSLSVNPYYIIDVFKTYQRSVDFDNDYLEIEKGKHE